VLGGAVLLAIGGAFLLPPLGVPNAGAYLFVALGAAFAAAWWVGARRQYVYLAPVFLGTLAIGLAAVFALAPERRVPLVLAGVIAIVALADLFLQIDLVPLALQPYFVPLVLIVVGPYLLVEQRGN